MVAVIESPFVIVPPSLPRAKYRPSVSLQIFGTRGRRIGLLGVLLRKSTVVKRSGIAESDREKIRAGKRGEEIFTKGSSEENTNNI